MLAQSQIASNSLEISEKCMGLAAVPNKNLHYAAHSNSGPDPLPTFAAPSHHGQWRQTGSVHCRILFSRGIVKSEQI
jgi:hypothetical protein